MRAWVVRSPGPLEERPLEMVTRDPPEPGPDEVLVEVSVCGVCRTDLHVVEGDLPAHRPGVVPGHEIVGRVVEKGSEVDDLVIGDRVGVPWLRRTCGSCRFCQAGRENLCDDPRFTGWDDDGGYAELAVAPAAYAYRLPESFDDEHAAPLLCAGIIGYRAYKRSALSTRGRLGIYGFGGSAHIAMQVALHQGAMVHVMTRSASARELATRLGAHSVQDATDPPPEPLDSAILFAPAGDLVPIALAALDRGGTLAIAGIHLSHIPSLDYEKHLFQERNLVSVTANTRADGREFMSLAAEIPIRVSTAPYPLSEADRALSDLKNGRVSGAAVLRGAERRTGIVEPSGPLSRSR